MTIPQGSIRTVTPVNTVIKQPQQIWSGGTGIAPLIVNDDAQNTLYVGSKADVLRQDQSSAIPIAPLGCQIWADVDIWAFAPVAVNTMLIIPGATSYQPSPAQVATAIANTGAPPINFHRLLFQLATPAVITAGSLQTLMNLPNNVTGTGYDIRIDLRSSAAATAQVIVTFYDTASGFVVEQVTYYAIAGGLAQGNVISLHGPSTGNSMTISVQAYTNNVTVNALAVYQNSRTYTRHLGQSIVWNATAFAGTVIANDPTNNNIGVFNANIGIGVTTSFLLPLYSGKVRLAGRTASFGADCNTAWFTIADTQLGSTQFIKQLSDAKGNFDYEASLPRTQCELQVTNNNAAIQNVQFVVIAEEY